MLLTSQGDQRIHPGCVSRRDRGGRERDYSKRERLGHERVWQRFVHQGAISTPMPLLFTRKLKKAPHFQ